MIKKNGEQSLTGNRFIEHYRAFKAERLGREDIEFSNNVILPSSALKIFDMKSLCNSKNPILFRISNSLLNIYTHCGVLEFTAENDICYLPSNMFDQLCLEEGQRVTIRAIILLPGTFIQLKPHEAEFLTLPNLQILLEYTLRSYFCLTEGDTISLQLPQLWKSPSKWKNEKKIYKIDVINVNLLKLLEHLTLILKLIFLHQKTMKNLVRIF